MLRLFLSFAALLGLMVPTQAFADPADVDAAARGVVRVVIIGTDGTEVYPVSHGTGFAITSSRIITNAHVVREALQDDTLRIGIVPPEGNDSGFAKPIAVSPKNDLALIEIVGDLRLPALTISGNDGADSGEVSAVGYPMNVDRAQGLDLNDIFNSQPPVKSRGFISGRRPSRQFDSILHTAPIARGNSGGPLLDGCGRVLGVNSFGADSSGSDAEFFFAVSNRELIPFLRDNNVSAQINALPCRSLAELDDAEQQRIEREQTAARIELAQRTEADRMKRDRVQLEAELEVAEARENAMAIAFLLILLGAGAGVVAWKAQRRGEESDERILMIGGTISAIAIVSALALWFTRPGIEAIDHKVNAAMAGEDEDGGENASDPANGTLVCTLQVDRSRITGTPDEAIEFDWAEDGCVNGRTQYGVSAGTWSRVFVPNETDAVAINSYDPGSKTFRTDRFLLSRTAMAEARTTRGKYSPPKCGAVGAATSLGDMQGGVTALLPESPNERLVYSCEVKGE
ncbi:trypsin-like peptidase domain-containing protein [Pontixanthobacter aestiaquae]|uniref:Trypsin-like serine protease n=1 Tax=Pontixanthobacter aestiaquae TaxID=1509367 RepID=A0A844Z621_9SPHN|nr:trypsin-like peptidase domain-containing protein [Pontixanthobacter aestiaquae]MDN3644908.1 trypsin-like peptidase domain-containing protein [Pontixanthobacter aestiaquae]MXO84091.1 trypsin-like serine protease [Pontixanthobacter aestiaquae]